MSDMTTGIGGRIRAIPLPENLPVTSADIIASLNEHLIITLQVCYIISCGLGDSTFMGHAPITLAFLVFVFCKSNLSTSLP